MISLAISVPLDDNGINSQSDHFPGSKLLNFDVENANQNPYSEKIKKVCLYCDEYTTLLKKYFGVVENELNKLKSSQRSAFPRDLFRNRGIYIDYQRSIESGAVNTKIGGFTF